MIFKPGSVTPVMSDLETLREDYRRLVSSHDAAMAAKDAEIAMWKQTAQELSSFSIRRDNLATKLEVDVAALERKVAQQASELSATLETGLIERLEILNVLNPMIDKRNDEIAALKATVAEQQSRHVNYLTITTVTLEEASKYIDDLKGDVAALLEAVAFYADKKNWDDRWVDPTGNPDDEGDSYDVISAVDVEWPDDKRKCPFGGLTARQAIHAHTERTKAREGKL